MRVKLALFPLLTLLAGSLHATDIQGVLADWKCTERMVKYGRAKVLKQDQSCSLRLNSARSAYGLITDSKKFYRLDAEGNKQAKELLNNSHQKNSLRVIAHGELEGNTIKVVTLSIL